MSIYISNTAIDVVCVHGADLVFLWSVFCWLYTTSSTLYKTVFPCAYLFSLYNGRGYMVPWILSLLIAEIYEINWPRDSRVFVLLISVEKETDAIRQHIYRRPFLQGFPVEADETTAYDCIIIFKGRNKTARRGQTVKIKDWSVRVFLVFRSVGKKISVRNRLPFVLAFQTRIFLRRD